MVFSCAVMASIPGRPDKVHVLIPPEDGMSKSGGRF